MSHKQIGNSGIDRPALSSIMNETHFFSHNARNVFRASSFLEHLGEPKMNHFFSCNHPLTLHIITTVQLLTIGMITKPKGVVRL